MRKALLVTVLLALVARGALAGAAAAPAAPRVSDPRLELTLVAADPEIVTPVGLAVAGDGRLFVLESHTHSPPRNYPGPASDRIKVFSPPDASGRSRPLGVFADGIEDGMNLAFSPAGDLFVVTSLSVLRLADHDRDGAADAHSAVLELRTPQRPFEHAALLGVAFSPDGWLYVSRGNVGSLRYTIKAAGDGSSVSGFGDGGNVVRCRPDGTKLEEVATGFWNPFGLDFDSAGRLLCVDNDPDARGPNRLVHVIPGGDYGYKSMYGGGGNHPFQAWNGELPGTLPFAAALGEAPCGVADASAAALPDDYVNTVLCTVWGEHNVTRVRLKPKGASVTAETALLVDGGQDFRPVAIAAARGGAVYFTDWVKRDYPNHGHGRLWRLSWRRTESGAEAPAAKAGATKPQAAEAAPPHVDPEDAFRALPDADPFVRARAVAALAAPEFHDAVVRATSHGSADVRLGALLALRRAGAATVDEAVVCRLLSDPDPRVRQVALIVAAEAPMPALRDQLAAAVRAPGTSPVLFETFLAATECLSPEFVAALQKGDESYANRLPRRLDPAVVESIVRDASAPAAARALALTRLTRPDERANLAALKTLLRSPDLALQVEAARTLAQGTARALLDPLRAAASDPNLPPDVRAEAILALSSQAPAEAGASLRPLLDDPSVPVQLETVRALQGAVTDEDVARALREKLRTLEGGDRVGAARVAEQIRFALHPAAGDNGRPDTVETWQAAVATGGDAASGRRLFYSSRAGCARCHTVHNRGGRLGPDLSNAGASRDRAKLLRAILRPSEEFSIDYQAWYVKTKTGDTHLGLQLDLKDRGDIELFTTDAKTVRFPGKDVAAYGASKQSLMPDGLQAGMSVGDMRDLLAYLESLR